MKNYSRCEIYGIAIKSEIDAFRFYDKFLRGLRRSKEIISSIALLAEKLEFLKKEEIKHRQLLSSLYSKEFPKVKLRLPQKGVIGLPVISPRERISLPSLLEKAMAAEGAAEKFYRDAWESSSNENSRRLFIYLASMEKGHYYLLKAEYDLLNTFSDYDSYKKFSLEHLGP